MVSKRRRKSPFVMDSERTALFIKPKDAGICDMILFFDGMELTYFDKRDGPYLTVRQAIDWHEKELQESRKQSGNAEVLKSLREAQAAFDEGRITEDKPC